MTSESPFATEIFWKRLIGWGLVLVGATAMVITAGLTDEVIDGTDLIIYGIEGLAAIGGLGLLVSPDPARL